MHAGSGYHVARPPTTYHQSGRRPRSNDLDMAMALAARIDVLHSGADFMAQLGRPLMQEQCLEVWVFHSRSLGQAVNAVERDLQILRAMVDFDVALLALPHRHCTRRGALCGRYLLQHHHYTQGGSF